LAKLQLVEPCAFLGGHSVVILNYLST